MLKVRQFGVRGGFIIGAGFRCPPSQVYIYIHTYIHIYTYTRHPVKGIPKNIIQKRDINKNWSETWEKETGRKKDAYVFMISCMLIWHKSIQAHFIDER